MDGRPTAEIKLRFQNAPVQCGRDQRTKPRIKTKGTIQVQ